MLLESMGSRQCLTLTFDLIWSHSVGQFGCRNRVYSSVMDHAAQVLDAVGDFVEVDGLLLEGASQALDEDVVHAPAPAIPGDGDT